jgi:hypothetical protein
LKSIVSPAVEMLIADRRLPTPESFAFVTTKVAAFPALAMATRPNANNVALNFIGQDISGLGEWSIIERELITDRGFLRPDARSRRKSQLVQMYFACFEVSSECLSGSATTMVTSPSASHRCSKSARFGHQTVK